MDPGLRRNHTVVDRTDSRGIKGLRAAGPVEVADREAEGAKGEDGVIPKANIVSSAVVFQKVIGANFFRINDIPSRLESRSPRTIDLLGDACK